jgi:hypothetical protein
VSIEIWAGALAPESYELVLTSAAEGGIDLSLVTGASLEVRSPDNTVSTWAATHVWDPVAETLTLTHTFHASSSELVKEGDWRVFAWLDVPGGRVRSRPRRVRVRNRFFVESDE